MKKVCRKCRMFVSGKVCPVNDPDCPTVKQSQYANNWQGRINIIDANKSEIAKKIGAKVKGEYAIKVS
ncbi:DNA-directed RNA polymerase subunit E'' [Candidatus Woesearchaeota archaeon]|nr:DNA-directed RNA polymerase subunit E'' [Candidatus Woesearchaeota archaeon]